MQPRPALPAVLRILLDDRGDALRRYRPAEEVALCRVAPPAPQEDGLLRRLHSLRHDTEVEIAGDADHRGDNRGVAVARLHVADEEAVDLHARDREALQVIQR